MTETDDRITEGLSADDRAFLDSLEEDRGLFRQIGDTWKGPLGGWTKLIFGFTVLMGFLFLFVIWQLANSAHHPFVHVLWAIAGVALLVILGFAKEWMFARMNMITILREVKRVQIEVALLREELSNTSNTRED